MDVLSTLERLAPELAKPSSRDNVFERESSDDVAEQFIGEEHRVSGLVGCK